MQPPWLTWENISGSMWHHVPLLLFGKNTLAWNAPTGLLPASQEPSAGAPWLLHCGLGPREPKALLLFHLLSSVCCRNWKCCQGELHTASYFDAFFLETVETPQHVCNCDWKDVFFRELLHFFLCCYVLWYVHPPGDNHGQALTSLSDIITDVCGLTCNCSSYQIPNRTFQDLTTLTTLILLMRANQLQLPVSKPTS